MIGPVLQRYGFELIHDPERLRNLVEYQCQKQHVPAPPDDTWLPVQERWLSGWPLRGSSQFLDRYRTLRTGLIRLLGGTSLESWLDQLPAITVMPVPRAEIEVGQQRGSQPTIADALQRMGWGGRLVLDAVPQQLPASLPESELHIVGSTEQPTQLQWQRALWRQGWLRLENLSLQGDLEIQGGLVELQRCTLQPGARIRLTGPGAFLVADASDLFGEIEAAACTLIHATNSNFETAATGIDTAGLLHLQGTALCSHPNTAVRLKERARALLEDCQLRDSGEGLQLADQSRATLRHCWLQANHKNAITARGDTRIHLENCQLRDNRADGILMQDRCQAHLVGNTIVDNGSAGVRWSDRVTIEKSGNTMRDNPQGDWLESRP